MSNKKNKAKVDKRTAQLTKTLSIQSSTGDVDRMNSHIWGRLSAMKGVRVYEQDGSIYASKGKAKTYPCIVAHTDTVHDIIRNFQVYKSGDHLFAINGDTIMRTGIGGDDNVGIHIALQVIEKLDVCKAAFFRDEESGCQGSKEADMKFFKNAEFVLQCDRKGIKDFVTSISSVELSSDAFKDAILEPLAKYDRDEVSGGMTDVWQLVENGLTVSAANMSCGYYKPHSDDEFVCITEVDATLNMVLDIFEAASGTVWTVDEEDRKKKWGNTSNYGYGKKNYGNSWQNNYNNQNSNNSDWEGKYSDKYKQSLGHQKSIGYKGGDSDELFDEWGNQIVGKKTSTEGTNSSVGNSVSSEDYKNSLGIVSPYSSEDELDYIECNACGCVAFFDYWDQGYFCYHCNGIVKKITTFIEGHDFIH